MSPGHCLGRPASFDDDDNAVVLGGPITWDQAEFNPDIDLSSISGDMPDTWGELMDNLHDLQAQGMVALLPEDPGYDEVLANLSAILGTPAVSAPNSTSPPEVAEVQIIPGMEVQYHELAAKVPEYKAILDKCQTELDALRHDLIDNLEDVEQVHAELMKSAIYWSHRDANTKYSAVTLSMEMMLA